MFSILSINECKIYTVEYFFIFGDLLIEKRIITDEKWEKKVKRRLKENEKLEKIE